MSQQNCVASRYAELQKALLIKRQKLQKADALSSKKLLSPLPNSHELSSINVGNTNHVSPPVSGENLNRTNYNFTFHIHELHPPFDSCDFVVQSSFCITEGLDYFLVALRTFEGNVKVFSIFKDSSESILLFHRSICNASSTPLAVSICNLASASVGISHVGVFLFLQDSTHSSLLAQVYDAQLDGGRNWLIRDAYVTTILLPNPSLILPSYVVDSLLLYVTDFGNLVISPVAGIGVVNHQISTLTGDICLRETVFDPDPRSLTAHQIFVAIKICQINDPGGPPISDLLVIALDHSFDIHVNRLTYAEARAGFVIANLWVCKPSFPDSEKFRSEDILTVSCSAYREPLPSRCEGLLVTFILRSTPSIDVSSDWLAIVLLPIIQSANSQLIALRKLSTALSHSDWAIFHGTDSPLRQILARLEKIKTPQSEAINRDAYDLSLWSVADILSGYIEPHAKSNLYSSPNIVKDPSIAVVIMGTMLKHNCLLSLCAYEKPCVVFRIL